jgi:hypothetical protein
MKTANAPKILAYIGSRAVGSLIGGKLRFSSAALGGKKFMTQESPAFTKGKEFQSMSRIETVARIEGEIWYKYNDGMRIWVTIVGDSALVEYVACGEAFGEAFLCSKSEARSRWAKFGKGESEKLS